MSYAPASVAYLYNGLLYSIGDSYYTQKIEDYYTPEIEEPQRPAVCMCCKEQRCLLRDVVFLEVREHKRKFWTLKDLCFFRLSTSEIYYVLTVFYDKKYMAEMWEQEVAQLAEEIDDYSTSDELFYFTSDSDDDL